MKEIDVHAGIDNQGEVTANQDIHAGIDNQGITNETLTPSMEGIVNQPQTVGPQTVGPQTVGSQMDSAVINKIQNTTIDPNKNAMTTSFGSCGQCGVSHPPLPNGETCPNASMSVVTNTPVKISDQDFNKFLVNMKNILVSQLDKLEVTNPQEIFKHLTMKIMEALEELKKK